MLKGQHKMNNQDKYSWHFKPFDMLRSNIESIGGKLNKIINILEEINKKLDKV